MKNFEVKYAIDWTIGYTSFGARMGSKAHFSCEVKAKTRDEAIQYIEANVDLTEFGKDAKLEITGVK